jgi:hypothetical protein
MLYRVYIVYAVALFLAYCGSRERIKNLMASLAPKKQWALPHYPPMRGLRRFRKWYFRICGDFDSTCTRIDTRRSSIGLLIVQRCCHTP